MLIHFDRGHYYSLDALARTAWARLADGAATAEDLADRFEEESQGPRGAMLESAQRFLDRLLELDLVVEAPAPDGAPLRSANGAPVANPAADAPASAPGAAPGAAERPPFREPRVQVFTDLEALLLLDPIHEVAPDGWPKAPAAP